MKKHILLTSVLIALLGGMLTGCNTMRGLGQDTERAGEKIQENAR